MKTQGSVLKLPDAMILISLVMSLSWGMVQAHPLIEPWQNRTASHSGLFLEPVGGFFTSSNNFDSSGTLSPLPNGALLNRIYLDLNASYGLNDDFFIFGRLSLLSTQTSITGQNTLSALGLSDQLLGAAFRAWSGEGGLSLNVQAEGSFPAYSNTNAKTNGAAYLGDGSTDLTGGVFVEIPLNAARDAYLESGIGYTYRSKGFSSAVPYSILLKRDPAHRGLLLEGGITGQLTLKSDIASSNSSLQTVLDQDRLAGSGGSNLLNALNPAWLQAQGKIGYRNRHGHRLYAGLGAPVLAARSAAGFNIVFGASLDFGPHPIEPEEEAPKTPKSTRQGFARYDLQAQVSSYHGDHYVLKIDRGSDDGVTKGQAFDIFDGDIPIARAQVSQLKSGESALKVIEFFKSSPIEPGFTARRIVR